MDTGVVEAVNVVSASEAQAVRAEASSSRRAAVTVYGGKGRSLRQTVIALASGARLAEHENPGEATVQVLSGRVRVSSDGGSWDGGPGDLLVVPQELHALEALEASSVLLTVATLP
ncbi:MAG: hypothetical protein JWN08_3571 [Frankiales bacterium]|nr:hypothetical protein [Frankiales bacterium]